MRRAAELIPVDVRPSFRHAVEESQMAAKLALFALALIVAWAVLFRPGRRPARAARRSASEPAPPPAALEPCARCGIYRLPDAGCDCGPESTSPR